MSATRWLVGIDHKLLEAIQAEDPTQMYQGGNMGAYVVGLIFEELGP